MANISYEKLTDASNELIRKMVNMELSVAEMEAVSENLPEALRDRIGDLHVSSDKLIGPIA